MTILLDEPADLLKLVGQHIGTTEWMEVTQEQIDRCVELWCQKGAVSVPCPSRSKIRAAVTVTSAQQKTSGVESVFTLTFEIDGEERPACAADVVMLFP